MGLPVDGEYQEGDQVAQDVRPQFQYAARKLPRDEVGRDVGHPYVQYQDSYGDGEDRIGEKDNAIQLPTCLWSYFRCFGQGFSFLDGPGWCPAV